MTASLDLSAPPSSPAAVVNFSRTASASSVAGSSGGGSLTRRSRIRRREEFSSGLYEQRGRARGMVSTSKEHIVPQPVLQLEIDAPVRPPRSLRRSVTAPQEGEGIVAPREGRPFRKRAMSSGASASRVATEALRGQQEQAHSEGGHSFQGKRSRALSLPRRDLRPPSPSDSSEQPSPLTPGVFNEIPPMPPINRNPRDSAITYQSATSSSLYPPSISTASRTESSMSLRSLPLSPTAASFDRFNYVGAVDPDDNPHSQELHDLDADDVSYRLRLLVKNNYYLPPAHSKPYPTELLTPTTVKKASPKQSTPAFLDIFKVGKSRSKPTTPDAPRFPHNTMGPLPMLRTTSDSTTVSAYNRQHTTRSLPHSPLLSPNPHPRQDRKGRVVVVRERMDDIVGAAKQAEHDLKTKEADRQRPMSESSNSKNDDDDIIDPTDAVDIPPLSAGAYAFAPQASAFHSMGIEASVGAAMLAERLPPNSPGVSSVDTEEAAWRKALLQEAVGHSLNNSPVVTPASAPAAALQLANDPSPSPISTLRIKRELGQRILPRIADEDLDSIPLPQFQPEVSTQLPQNGITDRSVTSARVSSGSYHVPRRAETPAVPTHPLAPPPRRHPLTPIRSIFQSEDLSLDQPGISRQPRIIRKTTSSPVLPNTYERHVSPSRANGTMTPPPVPNDRFSPSLVLRNPDGMVSVPSHETISILSSGSHYSDDQENEGAFHTPIDRSSEDIATRPSLTVSLPSYGRVSSEYSQPSPTVSAFRDALDNMQDTVQPTDQLTEREDSRISSAFDYTGNRSMIMTPPPRTSSSYANTVLTPAPRSRSKYATAASRSSTPSESLRTDDASNAKRRHNIDTSDTMPAPPAPSAPLTPQQTNSTLTVPGQSVTSIQSTISHPPSPISFFDEVEMSHMGDDVSSSEDEGDESDIGDPPFEKDDELEEHVKLPASGTREAEPVAELDQSDTESAVVFFDRTTNAISNIATGPRSTKSLMRLDNNSNPYLVPVSPTREVPPPMPYDSLDRRKPVTNVPLPPPPPLTTFKSRGKEGRSRALSAPRIPENVFERAKNRRTATSQEGGSNIGLSKTSGDRRPSTTGNVGVSHWRQEQSEQDESMRRLDGMLIQHMENERDTIRRITKTNTLGKP